MGDSRRVLLVLEDAALSDLLSEALIDAGHVAVQADGAAAAEAVLRAQPFDAVIVDLDTRARDGLALVTRARTFAPTVTVIALLPCGGLGDSGAPPPYHLAIEKPARLAALLSAVEAAPSAVRN
jgi:DNA-binding NtrC family response regulator